ncbi:hypothetical protein [Pimelobacter simplex]|uniref:hypothetical protein n=1 Tax=Nocardioides simplex TaxID=2045 RepID=UPI003AAEA97A
MTLLDLGSVGGGLYNLRRVSPPSIGRAGRRRMETPGGHETEVTSTRSSPLVPHATNEQRFAYLLDLCAEHRVRIQYEDLGPIRHGQYLRRYRRIDLNINLVLRQLVPGLGHEFGHFVFDDSCSTAPAERRAWEYSAQLIIRPEEYAAAERVVGHNVNAIALELDTTPILVESWRRWWRTQRPGDGVENAWGA